MNDYQKSDLEIWQAIADEKKRQQNNIELIASENIVSPAVLQAQGSVLTNKYAEGYPGHRYYGGTQFIDVVEQLAIDRAKSLFHAEYANVQPHSGSQANAAAYMALLNPGDTVLSMSLNAGGHLTHGAKVNFSGKFYDFHFYELDPKTERLNYDEISELAQKIKPKLIVAGASAYSRIIDFNKFREIADSVGAYLMVDMAHIAGLVAAGLHPSPVGIADIVTTTTHKTLRGPRGGMILSQEKYAKKLNSAVFPGQQGGPLEHVIAAKAIALKEAASPEFVEYAKQTIKNAQAMAKTFIENDFHVITGGTDNHLFNVDLRNTELTGLDAQNLLDTVSITLNKESIPNEPRSPFVTSGIRIGTPAVTTRNMKEEDMRSIAELIIKAFRNFNDQDTLNEVKISAQNLAKNHPVAGLE